ncbi:acyl-CoA dehydrogenase [Dichomitus squalens]|uniref:Acyl-CoA dehydrogenase n=1 Tax=Dichomitus squalens TaxID=114155 RepID=A0A4V2K5V2_9APHY|nr:acyl-CoA dehydrogenase [Dichomitus squalens LYAD-421 SS1]EJF64623.1 acyl-CoA dehydrogenase [Dichomitus squalens LYAD-421 SS1]TBU32529.1 acyl-CoA dehydrogenase [Dichomitus squalens]TBU49823.1 acyl-CoA dehydrogenase [Dichomitus squalens]
MSKELKTFSREDVAKHNKPDDLWIIVDAKVYDVTKFQGLHPGGISVFQEADIAGQDATEAFYGLHRHEVLERPQYKRLQIGVIQGEKSVIYSQIPGELSKIPYAEPLGLLKEYHSPYYTESHRKFLHAIRKFNDEVITPDALAREEDGKRPSSSVINQMAENGILAMNMGPGKHLEGRTLLGGLIKPGEFDRFHELILMQELVRHGMRGYRDGQNSGATIGLPPVIHFGRPELRDRIVDEVLSGRKFISLAITEAFAGSDVAGLKTTAKKTPDGKHWIINGTKKWITNGTFSDYFTVGCKTDKGLTVILVERQDGVETKAIKTSYSSTAGTAYITFENIKVPVENTLGPEGGGIFVILSNFNHERWAMCCGASRNMRLIVEECLKWVNQRKAFGKPLHAQPVIRAKLANMIAKSEAAQHWLESITFQMQHMDYKQQAQLLAGPIALLKMYITRSSQEVARDAVQVFGGRGITKTGMGKLIEHYHRTVPFDAVLGGAEDVLGDLGVRQAIKALPKNAKL